jgi:beta-glucanase (GH16 family)
MRRAKLATIPRLSILILCSLLVAGCATPAVLERFTAPPPNPASGAWTPPAGKTLVWSDEFNGPDIDLSAWSCETEATGWSPAWNGEWQRYTDNGAGGPNAAVSDGALVIRALKTSGGNGGYTSARLVTRTKRSWQYGVIVARLQLPYGQGIWPAFWLLGNAGLWPANGEIDVMEMIGGNTGGGSDHSTHGTIHWADPTNTHQYDGGQYLNAQPLAAAWHYYELEWSATLITIRFDGIEVMTRDIATSEYEEFRQPFYALLNLAVGGAWPGPPDTTTVFPQYMYVDWVRVYQ